MKVSFKSIFILVVWHATVQFVVGSDECPKDVCSGFHCNMTGLPRQYYDAAPESWIKVLNKNCITSPTNAPIKMQFAELFIEPNGIRETHWHVNSGEWGYVRSGSCFFTLMDNDGRYNYEEAVVGDIWYFPQGWQHYVQAGKDGCFVLLWFDTSSVNVDLTHTIAEMPRSIISKSLGNIGEDKVEKMVYPLYEEPCTGSCGARGVLSSTTPASKPAERCKGSRSDICEGTLREWPVFPIKGGTFNQVPGVGREYRVKQDIFPLAFTMSGGLLELEEGALREVHWHPDAEEHHYVLNGTVDVTVMGQDPATLRDSFRLTQGGVGVVPLNYVHYIQAVDGPATIVVTFNTPSWKTQTLSQTLATTPNDVNAATLGTSVYTVDVFFPSDFTPFIPDSSTCTTCKGDGSK